jgi:hypothetical protein
MLSGPGIYDFGRFYLWKHFFSFVLYFSQGQFAENETNEILFREIPWVAFFHFFKGV